MKVVIYDNDGMLTHSERFSDVYAAKMGLDSSVTGPFFEGPFKECLIGKADLKEELSKVLQTWKWTGTTDELLEFWFSCGDDLNDEMFDSVRKLREQGMVVCLATNNERYRTAYLVEKFTYEEIFDEVFTAYDLGAYKQSDEGLEKIAEILRTKHAIEDRAEVIFWDDREEHIENMNKHGFKGELYVNYENFKKTMSKYGHEV